MAELTSQQTAALGKFRTQVQDVLSPDLLKDDRYLLRWLRARKFDLPASEQMLRDCWKWRKANDVDNILATYKAPEVLEKYFTAAHIGFDKEGSPVWLGRIGKLDLKGILCSVKRSQCVAFGVSLLEKSAELMKEQTKKLGKPIETHYVILDMDGVPNQRIAHRPAVEFLRDMAVIYGRNYPESMKKVMVINASKLFNVAFAVIKPFIDDDTMNKFKIYGDNWRDELFNDVDAEVLPVHWGGTRTDGTGLDWCPKVLPEGGIIPAEYFATPGKKLAEVDGVETIVVNSGSSALVEADINESGSIIKWMFGTDGHDIQFGVYRRTPEGLEEHLPKERVTSHVIVEEGELECIDPGTYVLAFDNSHSVMRSKKVMFRVEVLPPQLREETIADSL